MFQRRQIRRCTIEVELIEFDQQADQACMSGLQAKPFTGMCSTVTLAIFIIFLTASLLFSKNDANFVHFMI
jgi:hypothetical protein